MPNHSKTILYYSPEKDIIMHQWQRFHFFDELMHHNITFEVFNPLHFENIEMAWEALLKQIKENRNKYDLFFTGIGNNFITPSIIHDIKKIGLPTVLICFDNLHGPYMHKELAPAFDLVWLTSFETEHMFKKWGANTIFLPYAANPYFFKPNNNQEINSVCFIGTPYGTRITRLNYLLSNDIPVSVYSDALKPSENNTISIQKKKISLQTKIRDVSNQLSFPIGRKIFLSEMKKKFFKPQSDFVLNNSDYLTVNPSVSFEAMTNLYSSFAVSLNITDIWNTYLLKKPVYKIHLRSFEIPMSGGLQITSYTDEIASYFEEDKEIIFYRNEEEMISKIKFYLKPENSVLGNNIKFAARKKAETDHTWFKRFEKIISKIQISSKFLN